MRLTQVKTNIFLGVILLGSTSLSIGYFLHSPLLMILAGAFGSLIGGLVGWLGGRRFMLIIILGMGLGAILGYSSGDRDITIMATGSGAAIAGFLDIQLERFLK